MGPGVFKPKSTDEKVGLERIWKLFQDAMGNLGCCQMIISLPQGFGKRRLGIGRGGRAA